MSMSRPIKELPTFVRRTYRGGKLIRKFLELPDPKDDFCPEDWISSFTEAKNHAPIENEGITKVNINGKELLITEAVSTADFGEGRTDSGVLIKYLDSAERLGIQVHPTKKYAREVFDSDYGKTECWHILEGREINGETPCVYLGFKENITKEKWTELFKSQDINGMLDCLHRFEVKAGDTILVTGGTPHAIGSGCFMVEIQEPSDYTMRVEKTTVAGEKLTENQIHYGVGEAKMLDCFEYIPRTEAETRAEFFLSEKNQGEALVTYSDTPCFALDRFCGEKTLKSDSAFTVIMLSNGAISYSDTTENTLRGDKFFIPANTEIKISGEGLICRSPELRKD